MVLGSPVAEYRSALNGPSTGEGNDLAIKEVTFRPGEEEYRLGALLH